MNRRSDHDETALHEHLDYLALPFIREHYAEFIREAAAAGADHLAPLMRLVEGEAALRKDRSVERRIRLARFPVRKTLDQFDWSWPRKINRLQIQNLFRLQFLDETANVVLIGGVGLGKSHLAIALAYTACQHGYSVLFASAIDIINTLMAARAGGRLKSSQPLRRPLTNADR
jgi:DNA replication protein DnaC